MKWINLFLFLLLFTVTAQAQHSGFERDFSMLEYRYMNSLTVQQDTVERREYPSPKSVMFKSLMIPGWGQIVNEQIWKVPIVYGLFAGVGVYTFYLHDQYKDYRTAYYNAVRSDEENDFRFGQTPDYLVGINQSELQSNRNSLRNRRDFMFVVMGLAYGLNAVDAYVYAHMRSFDVSDDLSARAIIQPTLMAEGKPGIKISLSLFKRN